MTRTNYVLVDFENVQPKDIGLLKDGPFKVKVFLGPNQSKIPVSLASSLQSLGDMPNTSLSERLEATPLIFISPITSVPSPPATQRRSFTSFQKTLALLLIGAIEPFRNRRNAATS